jgi:hypothetical protein
VNTLIDWVDQALLYLSVPTAWGDRSPRDDLRMFGIRTATDLVRVWDGAQPGTQLVRAQIARVLAGDEDMGRAAAEAILISLAGNPNLAHAQAFRGHDWLTPGADEGGQGGADRVSPVRSVGARSDQA